MTEQPKRSRFAADGVAAPLRHAVFRRIWLASLLSNLGILIQGVGAAWAMTQMTSSADKVALVQTALTAPVMLISMPAGAIADMYDRRIVALVASEYSAHRRDRPGGVCLARLGHAEISARTLLCRRQRHGTDGTSLAILGHRAGASGNASGRGRSERHQLQYRAQYRSGDRWRCRCGGRRDGGVHAQRDALSATDRRAVSLETRRRSLASAARKAAPRHRFRRALHHQFTIDQDRSDPQHGDWYDRRRDRRPDAAGDARSAASRRRRPMASCSAPSAWVR